jgi:cysteinyl-tRNA synthetase
MPNKRRPKETRLGKTLTQLGRWIRIGKLNLKLGYLKDNITDVNAEIGYINEQHGIHIEEVQEEWTQEVIEDLKSWWKILQARRS